MATLVNEGLVERAKLTCGATASPFIQYALLGVGLPAEAATVGYSDISAVILAGSGSDRVTATTHAYEANYKAKWVHTFTFTGTKTIYGIAILNVDNDVLMYHALPVQIEVHDGETAQITVTETEGRA